jgi:Mrp family chromosome partitioning ATPase
MATFFIFLLTFLDNTLNSPNQFKVLTGLPLLGTITKIKERDLDLKALFSSNSGSADLERFKELIRDLRFNFEKLGGGNTFLITSPREGEGKSFVITLLAHALLQKQKKVLVIDTNFKRNTLSTWAARPSYTSASLHQLLVDCKLTEHFAITSLKSPYNNSLIDSISNSGRNQSPLEGLDIRIFQHFIQELKLQYDYVLMEGAALNHYSDTKELLDFCDNVIAVFNSSTTLKQADKNSIAFLKSLGGQFAGSILNSVNRKDLN